MSETTGKRFGCGKFLFIAFGFFVLIVICVSAWVTRSYHSLANQIREKGEPATFEELTSWVAPVQDERNAALKFKKAMELAEKPKTNVKIPNVSPFTELPPSSEQWTEELRTATATFIEANKESYDLIREATQQPDSNYQLDVRLAAQGKESNVFTGVRDLTRFQCLCVAYEIDAGKTADAIDSAIRGLAVADSLRNEPFIISLLIRNACNAMGVASVERLLSSGSPVDGNLEPIQDKLQAMDDKEALYRAFVSERVIVMDSPVGFTSADEVLFLIFRKQTTRLVTEIVDASRLPNAERMVKIQAINANHNGVNASLLSELNMTAHFAGLLNSTRESWDRNTALLRCAAVAVAIERYRQATNVVPENLEALVPGFLDTVPLDPFDGKALKYLRDESGYVVYSFGPNLTDDRGTPYNASSKEGDVGVRIGGEEVPAEAQTAH